MESPGLYYTFLILTASCLLKGFLALKNDSSLNAGRESDSNINPTKKYNIELKVVKWGRRPLYRNIPSIIGVACLYNTDQRFDERDMITMMHLQDLEGKSYVTVRDKEPAFFKSDDLFDLRKFLNKYGQSVINFRVRNDGREQEFVCSVEGVAYKGRGLFVQNARYKFEIKNEKPAVAKVLLGLQILRSELEDMLWEPVETEVAHQLAEDSVLKDKRAKIEERQMEMIYSLEMQHFHQMEILQQLEAIENDTPVFKVSQAAEDGFDINGGPLMFSKVSCDNAGVYNPFTGVFTVPVGGYYLFKYGFYVHGAAYVHIDLNINARVEDKIIVASLNDSRKYVDGTYLAKLDPRDEVYLTVNRTSPQISDSTFSNTSYPNWFGGLLLKYASNLNDKIAYTDYATL